MRHNQFWIDMTLLPPLAAEPVRCRDISGLSLEMRIAEENRHGNPTILEKSPRNEKSPLQSNGLEEFIDTSVVGSRSSGAVLREEVRLAANDFRGEDVLLARFLIR